MAHYSNWRVFQIDLEANFSYVPVFSLPGGTDERNLSAVLAGWRLQ